MHRANSQHSRLVARGSGRLCCLWYPRCWYHAPAGVVVNEEPVGAVCILRFPHLPCGEDGPDSAVLPPRDTAIPAQNSPESEAYPPRQPARTCPTDWPRCSGRFHGTSRGRCRAVAARLGGFGPAVPPADLSGHSSPDRCGPGRAREPARAAMRVRHDKPPDAAAVARSVSRGRSRRRTRAAAHASEALLGDAPVARSAASELDEGRRACLAARPGAGRTRAADPHTGSRALSASALRWPLPDGWLRWIVRRLNCGGSRALSSASRPAGMIATSCLPVCGIPSARRAGDLGRSPISDRAWTSGELFRGHGMVERCRKTRRPLGGQSHGAGHDVAGAWA